MGGSKRNRRWNLIKNESSNRQYLGTYSPDDAHLFGSRQRYVLWSPLALPRRYLFTYFQTLFSCSFVFFFLVLNISFFLLFYIFQRPVSAFLHCVRLCIPITSDDDPGRDAPSFQQTFLLFHNVPSKRDSDWNG